MNTLPVEIRVRPGRTPGTSLGEAVAVNASGVAVYTFGVCVGTCEAGVVRELNLMLDEQALARQVLPHPGLTLRRAA